MPTLQRDLGPPDRIHAGDHGRTCIHRNWLPWSAGSRERWPHLPQYPGFVLLGVGEFVCVNDVQGELRFFVPVYQHERSRECLENAGVEMDRRGSHPACEFVRLPAFGEDGTFLFGDPAEHGDDPQVFEVHIAQPFLIGRTPVVQAVYEGVMGTNPSHHVGVLHPVEQVSWDEAQAFCDALGLRLPSETEWEYACRGGSTTTFCFGDDAGRLKEFAWFADNARGETHPVAQLAHNGFGIFDAHGNVWEWCQDEWHSLEDGLRTDGSAWGGPEADPYAQWHPGLSSLSAAAGTGSEGENRADPLLSEAEVGAAAASPAPLGPGSSPATGLTISDTASQEGENRTDPSPSLVGETTDARPRPNVPASGSPGPDGVTSPHVQDAPRATTTRGSGRPEGEQGPDPTSPCSEGPAATNVLTPPRPSSSQPGNAAPRLESESPEGEQSADPSSSTRAPGPTSIEATPSEAASTIAAEDQHAAEVTPSASESEGEQRVGPTTPGPSWPSPCLPVGPPAVLSPQPRGVSPSTQPTGASSPSAAGVSARAARAAPSPSSAGRPKEPTDSQPGTQPASAPAEDEAEDETPLLMYGQSFEATLAALLGPLPAYRVTRGACTDDDAEDAQRVAAVGPCEDTGFRAGC